MNSGVFVESIEQEVAGSKFLSPEGQASPSCNDDEFYLIQQSYRVSNGIFLVNVFE